MGGNGINSARRSASMLLGSVVALSAVAPVVCTTAQAQETLYRETFKYCTASLGTPASEQAQWFAFNTGIRVGKVGNLKVFSFGSSDIGGDVNSNPVGFAEGYAFWSRATYGLTVFTREFAVPVSAISRVEYIQRLSGINAAGAANATRLAFLIGDTWYISSRSVAQTNGGVNYELATFDVTNELFGTVIDIPGRGPAIPSNYENGVPLPATGTVTAFGVFLDEVNGRVRLDNFVLKGASGGTIPPAVQTSDVSSCPADSPDRTGVPSTTPTPTPEDPEGGGGTGQPEQQIPEEPVPPQLNNNFKFCPASEQGSGARVQFGQKAKRMLMKTSTTSQASDYRDAVIMTLFASRSLPVGALVNVKLSDYNATAGTLSLVLRKGLAPATIRLSAKAKEALDTYLAQVRSGVPVGAPLIVSIDPPTKVINLQQAACTSEITRTIRARAKASKLGKEVVFVKVKARR